MKTRPSLTIFFAISALVILSVLFQKPQPKIIKEKKGEAAEALGNWLDARVYPGNQLKTDAYQNAFQKFQQQKLNRTSSFSGQWDAIGPKNFGGRTLCLAFNPQNTETVFAGAASGGLWRSYTGGTGANAWQPIPTGFPVNAVSAIAVHPSDSNTILIGTGEVYNYQNTGTGFAIRTTRGIYGIGILKTTDGGLTWTQTLPWQLNDLRGVQDIIINPLNPNSVFAATSEGTYRSSDAGTTWALCHNVLMATDINYMPGDTTIILLAAGNSFSANSGVYRSIDGGLTFVKITSGLPASWSGKALITFCELQPDVVYASIANQLSGIGLFKSINGGLNWGIVNNLNFATYQGWYSHDVAVRPDNPDQVFCGGIDSYLSLDGGVTLNQSSYWQNWDFNATIIGGPEGLPDYIHADIHRIYWHPSDFDIIYYATDGGIFRTINNGNTFEGCNGMYQTQQFYANFSNSSQDSLFAIGGMQDNATAVYEGNPGWRRVIGGDGVSTAINPDDDNIVYGESQYLNIRRSDNRAQFFNGLNILGGNIQNFAGPFVLCHSNPDVMYAGSDYVEKSTDGGFSWIYTNGQVPLDGNPVLVLEASRSNSDIVYAATSPIVLPQVNLYKTVDGGISWTDVTPGLPNRYIMDVAIDPDNNQNVFVAISGFGTDHIYKTTDGGTTWNASGTALPDVPTNTICIDPLNPATIYIGNDLGIFVSVDGGTSWSDYNDGLFDATLVMDISVSPVNRKLRIATHGRGIFERPMLPLTVGMSSLPDNTFTIRAYPNPVIEQTQLFFKTTFTKNTDLKLYNSNGRLVRSWNGIHIFNEMKFTLNMTDLEVGVYFFKAGDGKGVQTLKLIKTGRN